MGAKNGRGHRGYRRAGRHGCQERTRVAWAFQSMCGDPVKFSVAQSFVGPDECGHAVGHSRVEVVIVCLVYRPGPCFCVRVGRDLYEHERHASRLLQEQREQCKKF